MPPALPPKVLAFVMPGSILFTDEWGGYNEAGRL
jgi:hypothetical protein